MKLFAESNQSTPWRNKVARDLNTLLTRVEYVQETTNDESDQEFAAAALAAEFEEIEAVPE